MAGIEDQQAGLVEPDVAIAGAGQHQGQETR